LRLRPRACGPHSSRYHRPPHRRPRGPPFDRPRPGALLDRAFREALGCSSFRETIVIDVEKLRAETPGCRNVIHFNNAGAALEPRPVLDAVLGHLRLEAEIGGYEAADRAEAALEGVYASLARLINGSPDEIALIENATRAWDMAFYSLKLGPGDRILPAAAEYPSNLITFPH